MTDTITPASKFTAEEWRAGERIARANGFIGEADHYAEQAARLEAESARETSVETLARALAENFTDSTRWDWLTVSRAAHAFFAAGGRLLPKGGTVLTAAEADDVRAFMRWAAGRNNGMAHPDEAAYRIRVKFGLYDSWVPAPPAASVPDSGPDGTPEKPWPTWQEVPEGVPYTNHEDGEVRHGHWINRDGMRFYVTPNGIERPSTSSELWMSDVAPFVRVDGDNA